MTQELLHEMQEKLPIFLLFAAGLLDLCGASRSEHDASEVLDLSFPGDAQPRAEISPVPSEGLPVTEDDLEEVTSHFQSPAADPTKETAAASVPAHRERAANRTALLPGHLAGNLQVSEPLHTQTAAVKLQHGLALPGKPLGSLSIPVSTQGPQATTPLEQPARSLQRKPGETPGADASPASPGARLPQPLPTVGTHQDPPELTAVPSPSVLPSAGTHQDPPKLTAVPSPSVLKQMEVTRPKTSLLTSAVHFYPPGKEAAAPPSATGVRTALGSAGLGWAPTGVPPTSKRPRDTSRAGVAPAHLEKTQGMDAGVTTSTVPAKPGDLGGVYSRTTQARAVQFSPGLSLQQETTASKGRNSTAAVTNGPGHPTQLPALQTLPPGHVHPSLLMESPVPSALNPSPFQGPLSTTGGQQPLTLYRALNCSKCASQETTRSSQETTVVALQRDADHGMMTRNPGKSLSPESPQTSANPSSLSPTEISTLKLFQTTKEQKEVTSAPSPGMSAFGDADLQPWDPVQEGLQPPGASFPTHAGLQPMGIPPSAERRLFMPTTSSTSTGSGAQAQGVSAHPVSQEAFAVVLQLSTVEDSRRKQSLPQQTGETGSAAASPVPSPSAPQGHRNQTVPSPSLAPPAPQTHHAGSLAASASEVPPPHARGSQSSPTTAHPAPVVPSAPAEVPAHLAQALVQQFRMSLDAATRNLSAGGGDPLPLLPPAPYLSFLFKSTNGMICLQPMQESPLPTKFPNTSVGGLVSIQQILAASNSSALDLVNFQHESPSSLVLVRPVFLLLPTDRADSPFPQGEGDHKTAHLVTNGVTPESSHGKTSCSYPTAKSETTLSTVSNQQAERTKVTSQPTTPNDTALLGLGQAATSAPGPLLDPGMGMSSTAQALHLPKMPEEMQIPAPHSQEAKGTDLLFLSRVLAEPGTSPVPPSAVPTQQSPHISPKAFFTTDTPHSVTPLLPAKGLHDSPVPAQPLPTSTGAAGRVQHRGPLQAAPHGQGSVPTLSSAPAPCRGCLASRSAGTTKTPLKVFTSTKALQATHQRLPRTTLSPVVPSTSSASSVLPVGNEHRGAALGSTARSGGASVPATAAQTPITSAQPDLTQRLEFTAMVPKPFVRTERPTAAPGQNPFPTEGQRKAVVSGTLLAAVTPPRVYSSPPAPAHIPLLAALKRDQTHHAPAKLFPQGSVGDITKPTETSTSSGKAGAGQSLGASVSLPGTTGTGAQQPPTAAAPGSGLVLAAAQPSVPTGPGTARERHPKPTQGTPQAPSALPALSAPQDGHTTTALTTRKVLPLPTSAFQPDPHWVLPTAARVTPSAVGLAAVGKGEGEAKGDTAPSSHLPTQAPMSASPRHPLGKVSLEDATGQEEAMRQKAGHSSPGSAVSATGPPTTAFAVSKRLVNQVTHQPAGSQKAAGSDAELTRDPIQLLPTPESPSDPAGSLGALTAQGTALLGVAATDPSERLLWHTEAEEMGRTQEEVTDLVTVVTLLDPQPSAPSDPHQRRGLHSDVTILNGLAVLSDATCGSGNHTVRLSLSPAGDASPEPQGPPAPSQDTFLALVAVQDNSSHSLEQPLEQPLVQIRSCCVTPSASPTAPGAQCCLFHRLPSECRHIQLLQSSRSSSASFTIQLFQMLNHSMAYLHCELNVCLHGKAGCEQDCFESVEPILQPSDRNSYGNLHNLVSFGPVWRMKDRFLYKPVEGPGPALLLPILLGSLTGFAVLGTAFMGLWLYHRQKTKPICYPHFGEVHGL